MPGRNCGSPAGGLRGRLLRQATITSWKLLPDDAAALIDALEYEQDVAAAEAAAFDETLLRSHPLAPGGARSALMRPTPVYGVKKAVSALLRASLDGVGMGRQVPAPNVAVTHTKVASSLVALPSVRVARQKKAKGPSDQNG